MVVLTTVILKNCSKADTMVLRWYLLVIIAVTAVSSLVAGSESYTIHQPSFQLPNGSTVPARTYAIDRPADGTYVPGRVIVKTRSTYGVHRGENHIMGSTANAALASARVDAVTMAYGGGAPQLPYEDIKLEQAVGLDRTYEIRYSEPIHPYDLCQQLMASPDVEYAVPVRVHRLYFTPNDPLYAQQAWLTNMRLEGAWDVTKGSKDVIVAIVDSGTDWQHADLSAQIFTNSKEIPNNNRDDDGNGFIDDVRGWDFVGNVTLQEAMGGVLKPDNDPRIMGTQINGTNGHGTVVAGCAGASTNNAVGVASTGFNITILPIKCGSDRTDVPSILEGYTAIRYAADMGAHIINCSWGGNGSAPDMQAVIDYATAKGSLVIAASGNDGTDNDVVPHNPSNLAGVVSVGASNNNDRVAGFSNYGWSVDVYAPGENVRSTWHGGGYNALSGTSFSAPLVSGVAALIKAVHPDWTPEMIAAQLRSTADEMSTVSAANRPKYFGRINAERAVKINRTLTSGDRLPGISVVGASITGGGTIRTYNPTEITLQLRNVLAEATNTQLTITTSTPGVTIVGGNTLNVGTIGHMKEVATPVTLQLDAAFPWYVANIELQIAIKVGAYLNFARVDVPVALTTSNVFSAYLANTGGQFTFEAVDATANGVFWATTTYLNQPAMVRSGGGNLQSAPFRVTSALSAISATSAVLGGTRNGSPTLALTTNGGSSWTYSNVGTTMTSVAAVRMFTAQNGLAVGTGAGSQIGVMKTTNGGSTWAAVASAPAISGTSENVLPKTVFFHGQHAWLGTSANRVLFTTDAGTTWRQGRLSVNGAVITSIAFKDANNGVMLYRTSGSASAPYRIAKTTTGGASWIVDVFDPSTLGITPVMVNSPGGHHLLVGSNGEVFGSDNNGENWQPILSQPNGQVVATAAVMGSRPMLYTAGHGIGQLSYRYAGPNGSRIATLDATVMEFDTVESGKNRQRITRLNSTGESDIAVDSIVILPKGNTPADAFRITIPLDDVIYAGTSDQMGVRVYATTPGMYEADLVIYTNATPAVLTITMRAFVPNPVSVTEQLDAVRGLFPNPARDEVSVLAPVGATIALIGTDGHIAHQTTSSHGGVVSISTAQLPAGSYVVRVSTGAEARILPLRIVR